MGFKINDDHWAFLDEIEAPMWVDLSLEANPISNDQNIDDMWFYTSHQFHQCSSSHLKSVFSHGGDENLFGPSPSPNLPRSVSKSRGKQYRSEKWKWDNKGISLDKSHPVNVLTGKSSIAKVTKPNSRSTNSNEASTSKSSICGASSSEKVNSPSCSDILIECENCIKTSEGNSKSAITSEKSQAFGQTNELLLMMKKSIRKSYITRQAMRVEIQNSEKKIIGRNSISSKSSVGSSSNPRNGVGILNSSSLRTKEITPESRNVKKAPSLKVDERASNNRRRQVINTLRPARNEAAKQKVQYRDSRSKVSVLFGVNKQNSTLVPMKLKKKMEMGIDGTENVNGISSMSQKKFNGKGIGEGVSGKDEKETKQQSLLSGTIASKGKRRGQGNSEKLKNFVQRVHFR